MGRPVLHAERTLQVWKSAVSSVSSIRKRGIFASSTEKKVDPYDPSRFAWMWYPPDRRFAGTFQRHCT